MIKQGGPMTAEEAEEFETLLQGYDVDSRASSSRLGWLWEAAWA